MNLRIRLMQTGESRWYAEAFVAGSTGSIIVTLTHETALAAIAEMDAELINLNVNLDNTRKKWLENLKEQGLIPE